MTDAKERVLNRLFLAFLALTFVLFSASVFKHLSYPLLWNDEGDTAMFATRVLEYGFPKVFDGKNIVYVHPVDIKIGVTDFGMFIADPILSYYLAVPGAWLAEKAVDIYDKTLLFRLPFTLIGLLGVAVMALGAANLFERGRPGRPLFLALFFLFSLLSISLALHLREARYSPPTILFFSCFLYVYIKHRLLNETSFRVYLGVSVFMLFLVFNVFHPLYFITIASVGLYELLALLKKMREERGAGRGFALPSASDLKHFVPLLISVLTVAPLLFVFKTILVVATMTSGVGGFIPERFLGNLQFVLSYFARHEFLYVALLMKAALAVLVLRMRARGAALPGKAAKKVRVSNFLTFFFIVHVVVTAATPVVFTRYFIVLQPVLTVIMLLDAFSAFELMGGGQKGGERKWQAALLASSAVLMVIALSGKAEDIKGYAYELTHQYKGPLDFVVPYVIENYERPEDLIIAANYEEASLMYYLKSMVIIGFIGVNLEEDMKETPDLIIHRDFWPDIPYPFPALLAKAEYGKVALPVRDYRVNNIPDLHNPIRHLYRTPAPRTDGERMTIFVRK